LSHDTLSHVPLQTSPMGTMIFSFFRILLYFLAFFDISNIDLLVFLLLSQE